MNCQASSGSTSRSVSRKGSMAPSMERQMRSRKLSALTWHLQGQRGAIVGFCGVAARAAPSPSRPSGSTPPPLKGGRKGAKSRRQAPFLHPFRGGGGEGAARDGEGEFRPHRHTRLPCPLGGRCPASLSVLND